MVAITPPVARRVCLNAQGTHLYTDPLALDKELQQVRDGLAALHGAVNVWIVEETASRKRIPDPPGELMLIENGTQIRKLSTDWPTLEKALIAKRGPLKDWAHEEVRHANWHRTLSCTPMLKAVAEELDLPGTVEALSWHQGSRMVEILYHTS